MSNPRKLKRAVIKEEFVAVTGDLISAIFLNQLLYWTERVADIDAYLVEEKARGRVADIELTHGWIYKKAEELIDETMVAISPSTAHRRLRDLVSMGIVESRTNPNNRWDKVLQYRVNLVTLSAALAAEGYALEGYTLPDLAGAPAKQAEETGRQYEASVPNPEIPTIHVERSNLQTELPKRQIDSSEFHGDAAIPEITTKITSEITSENEPRSRAGDGQVQTVLPATAALAQPSPIPEGNSPPPPSPSPVAAPASPPAQADEAKVVKTLSDTLQKVGVGVSQYLIDQYVDLVNDYGLHPAVAGILAAAENGKQHRLQYVKACIRSVAEGRTSQKGQATYADAGHRNGSGYDNSGGGFDGPFAPTKPAKAIVFYTDPDAPF